MPSPIAIVLGGTNPHAELCRNLKRRGYHVVLIDYYENPPAKTAADEHIRESTLDKDKVLQIAREKNASLVISTCIDQANVTACYVGEKLGLPIPYPYETALRISSKIGMKSAMLEAGIPTTPFIPIESNETSDISTLQFPLIVKPTDCNGSKGVVKINSPEEFPAARNQAIDLSPSSTALVEEYFDGTEIQIDFLVTNGSASLIMTREKMKLADRPGEVEQMAGSLTPADLSEKLLHELQQIGQKIADFYNLENTILFIQALVNHDAINVIEFAPRIGGGLSHRLIEVATGINIIDASIDSLLGTQKPNLGTRSTRFHATSLLYTKACTFGHIEGAEKLLEDGIIKEFHIYKKSGDVIDSDRASRNRVAGLIIEAPDRETISNRIQEARRRLKTFSISGESV